MIGLSLLASPLTLFLSLKYLDAWGTLTYHTYKIKGRRDA